MTDSAALPRSYAKGRHPIFDRSLGEMTFWAADRFEGLSLAKN